MKEIYLDDILPDRPVDERGVYYDIQLATEPEAYMTLLRSLTDHYHRVGKKIRNYSVIKYHYKNPDVIAALTSKGECERLIELGTVDDGLFILMGVKYTYGSDWPFLCRQGRVVRFFIDLNQDMVMVALTFPYHIKNDYQEHANFSDLIPFYQLGLRSLL